MPADLHHLECINSRHSFLNDLAFQVNAIASPGERLVTVSLPPTNKGVDGAFIGTQFVIFLIRCVQMFLFCQPFLVGNLIGSKAPVRFVVAPICE